MAKREISIIIRARNAMAAGLLSAGKSLQSFGRSALNIGKFFATAFLSAGTALAGFAVKALSAYSVQQKAVQSLTSALSAYGENSAALVPKLKAVASAIQDETGAADEETIATMARLKLAGVQTSQLEAAAKAVVALKAKNVEGAAAERMVGAALAGNFTAWNRQIPLLRTATSDAEKAAMVNAFLTAGYQSQKDALGTVAGSWAALKGRVGDAWEEIGAAISQNGVLVGELQRAGEAVKDFAAQVSEWAAGGGVGELLYGVKAFAAEAKFNFKLVGGYASVLWASLSDGAETAFNYIVGFATAWKDTLVAQFKYVAGWATAVWEKVKSPGSAFDPPSLDGIKQSLKDYADAAMGKDALVAKRTKAALDGMLQDEVDHRAEIADLEKARLADLQASADKRVQIEKKAGEKIVIAAEGMAAKVKKTQQDQQAEIDRLKKAEEKAAEEAGAAKETAAKKRDLFLSKDARDADKAAQKAAAKEKRQIELFNKKVESGAFQRGRLSGQSIKRGLAAAAAEKEAAAKADAASKAKSAREAAEAAMQKNMDRTATAAEQTATNTGFLEEALTPA